MSYDQKILKLFKVIFNRSKFTFIQIISNYLESDQSLFEKLLISKKYKLDTEFDYNNFISYRAKTAECKCIKKNYIIYFQYIKHNKTYNYEIDIKWIKKYVCKKHIDQIIDHFHNFRQFDIKFGNKIDSIHLEYNLIPNYKLYTSVL
jgi:hypothetical protein